MIDAMKDELKEEETQEEMDQFHKDAAIIHKSVVCYCVQCNVAIVKTICMLLI
jgi:hypothetical protein